MFSISILLLLAFLLPVCPAFKTVSKNRTPAAFVCLGGVIRAAAYGCVTKKPASGRTGPKADFIVSTPLLYCPAAPAVKQKEREKFRTAAAALFQAWPGFVSRGCFAVSCTHAGRKPLFQALRADFTFAHAQQ